MPLLLWFIVPLLLLVALPHELAHLLAARRLGVTVHEFGLGLPPRATSVTWKGIRWSLNWLVPFGAFVTLKGEHAGQAPDDFSALSPGRRSLVVLAGPLANLLVAGLAVLLSGLLIGEPTGLRAVVTRADPTRTPDGLRAGDVLVAIDGAPVGQSEALAQALAAAAGRPVRVVVERAGRRVEAVLLAGPGSVEVRPRMGYVPIQSASGVLHALQPLANPSADGVSLGLGHPEQVAVLGWIGLAQVMQELGDVGIPPLAWFLALLASLSLGLGLTNLLPIPPLDGGRVALYAVEALRQRPLVAPRLMTRLNLVGLLVLVAVFCLVTGTDVLRVLSGQSILTIH